MGFKNRLQHAWNALTNKDPTVNDNYTGYSNTSRPDRHRLSRGNEKSIATSVFNRIAIDAASININHARLDQNGRF